MGMNLNDPETWKSLWNDALSESNQLDNRKAESPESIDRWNQRAEQFTARVVSPQLQDERQALIDWLQECGALKEGDRVLDIGAGSGRYALSFAKMGCEVVAVEPAKSMVDHFQQQMEKEQVTNIKIINQPWQTVDLEKEDLKRGFDLAFASMTPGISSPDDLLKMMETSRRSCYHSAHTRGRWHHMEAFWKEVLGKEMPVSPGNFMYRFGLVYAMGYSPITRPRNRNRGNAGWNRSPEKLKEDILWSLSRYSEITSEMEKKIDEYVDSLFTKDDYQADNNKISGMSMVWFVN